MDPFSGFVDNGPVPQAPVGQTGGFAPAAAADPFSGFRDEGPNSKPRMDVSTSRAALEGYLDTAGFGFRDEIKGMSEASGLPAWMGGFRAPVGGAKLLYEAATGPGKATETYKTETAKARDVQRQAEEQHPYAYLSGQVGGAAVAPGMGMAGEAATVGARAVRAAKIGAAQGGLYGLGSGETPSERAERAAIGAGIGGITGAVASPIADVAGAGLKKGWQGAQSIYNTLRAEISPEAASDIVENEAAKRIVASGIADMESQGPAYSAEESAAAKQGSIPLSIADTGGQRTLALARSAANQSPEARAALDNVVNPRFQAQSSRAAGFIRDLTGGADATVDLDAIQAAGRKANRGAYAKAYADGSHGLWSPELERLSGDPALVAAAKGAAQSGQTRAIADGFGAFNPGLNVTDDGRLIINNRRTGTPTYPDLQFWDYTYRNLRDAASEAFRRGRNSEGNAMAQNARSLRNELDNLVPSFKDARAGAAAAFGAEDALEAGRKFVWAKGENSDYAKAIGKFSDPEKELFARGFASETADRVRELGNSVDVVKQAFLTSNAAKQRIAMALGPDRAKQLEVYLRAEGLSDRLRQALGNSTTARQLAEMGLAGAGTLALGHAGIEGEWDTKHLLTAGLLLGAAYGKHRSQVLEVSVARRIGEMLASNDPAVLKRGIEIVAKNDKMLSAIRNAGDKLETAIAGKSIPRAALQYVQGPSSIAAQPNQNQ